MYKDMLSYFNLSGMPFTKEIKTDQLHVLPSVERNLASTKLLVETRGIGILVGKSGSGKSCLLRLLKNSLNPSLYKTAYICHSSIGVLEFYTHLTAAFGISARARRSDMFRELKKHILSLNSSQNIHPVLILDEAHFLNYDILQEIRMLTNFEIDSLNAMTVLLCGQECLTQKFGLTILESRANSITISIQVESLPQEETYAFIENRIKECGFHSALFTQSAMALIHQAAGGLFRSIGIIAQGAMLKAYLSKSPQVEAEHVKSVIGR